MKNELQVRKLVTSAIPKFWLYTIASFIFSLLIHFAGLIPPLLMRTVIDELIPEGDTSQTIFYIILFVTVPIVITISNGVYSFIVAHTGRKSGQVLMSRAFEKLVNQPVAYFDKRNVSEIVTHCRSDAMGYVVFWLADLPKMAGGLFVGVAVYVLLFSTNHFLALGLLLYIPLCVFPSRFLSKLIETPIKKVIDNNAKVTQLMNDTLKGIKYVKGMCLGQKRINEVNEVNKDTLKYWGKISLLDNLNGTWTTNFLDNLFIGIVFSVAALLVIFGYLTIGAVVLILGYLPIFFNAVSTITNTSFEFKMQLAEFDKFFEIMTLKDNPDSGKDEFKFTEKIAFSNVAFSYAEDRGKVLENLSLEFEKGKWSGIIGSSGAGKTTIFDLILKFYNINEGLITIDGKNINEINIDSIRKNITKVSQDLFLFPGSLRSNLELISHNSNENEMPAALKDAGLGELIERLPDGLDTNVGEDGTQLSGGEKQRLCLAIGLLRKSNVLLLDEITSNVDIEIEKEIVTNIKELMDSRGITVISISHRQNFLDLADKIIELQPTQ